jgi:hypothetical protein
MPGSWLAVPPPTECDHGAHDHDQQNHQAYCAPVLSRVGHSATSSIFLALTFGLLHSF